MGKNILMCSLRRLWWGISWGSFSQTRREFNYVKTKNKYIDARDSPFSTPPSAKRNMSNQDYHFGHSFFDGYFDS